MYYCVFCEIIARREPARVEYEDDDVIVFHNRLDWADPMLLAVPKQHLYQGELWISDVMAKVARVAVMMGQRHCSNGFRLVSNFGAHGMQSQMHAHVHVVDGKHLRRFPQSPATVHYEEANVVVYRNDVERWPINMLATPREAATQAELWTSDVIGDVARVAATLGGEHCASGFRLFSDFGLEPEPGDEAGHVHIIGGTYLGEYA